MEDLTDEQRIRYGETVELPVNDGRDGYSIAGLRSRATSLTDLRPENLRAMFGHGKTMFDLINTPRPVAAGVARD